MAITKTRVATHPGEILSEEFLKPIGLTGNAIALDLHVPANRISEIVAGRRSITPDTAMRLSIYFGNSAQFWMDLQRNYDLDRVRLRDEARLRAEIRPRR